MRLNCEACSSAGEPLYSFRAPELGPGHTSKQNTHCTVRALHTNISKRYHHHLEASAEQGPHSSTAQVQIHKLRQGLRIL